MALVLKDFEFSVEGDDCIRQAVNILKDELFGINVDLCRKLIASALESYLVDKILTLPPRAIEESYCIFYDMISGHHESVVNGEFQDAIYSIQDDEMDTLGITKEEKEKVYRLAAILMRGGLKAVGKQEKKIVGTVANEAADLYENIVKPMVKLSKDIVTEAKAVETESADLYKNIMKPMVKLGMDFVTEAKAVETESADLYKNIMKPMVKLGMDIVTEAKAVETESADLYKNIMKPMVKLGMDIVTEAKAVETESADLYKNIMKPMVKLGMDIVTEAKAVETECADLYKNIMKPMVKLGMDIVTEAKSVETESADLYKNILKPFVKVGIEFVAQAKDIEAESIDLYNNLLKPMVKCGSDIVLEGYCERNFDVLLKNITEAPLLDKVPMFIETSEPTTIAASA